MGFADILVGGIACLVGNLPRYLLAGLVRVPELARCALQRRLIKRVELDELLAGVDLRRHADRGFGCSFWYSPTLWAITCLVSVSMT